MPSTQERQPKVTIHKQQGQNQCFDEVLGDAGHLRMMQIPGETFLMGSPEDEPERQEREGPQHEVAIPTFFMGKYPVTQLQWRFVATLEAVSRELEFDPSNFKGDDRPVEQLSWYDAVEFCARLSRHTGREYRLPTEAEWEYACRAGTKTPFHFGETISPELANYYSENTYNNSPKALYLGKTTSVFHFEVANAWGLCDMHGNVLEWCQDHYHSSYEDAPNDGSAWLTDDQDARRILRGGSWDNYPEDCRSAYRDFNLPDDRYNNIGFRVVCSAPRILQVKTR